MNNGARDERRAQFALAEEIKRALAQRHAAQFAGRIAGNHDHRNVRPEIAQAPQCLDPARIRQIQTEDRGIYILLLLERRNSLAQSRDLQHLEGIVRNLGEPLARKIGMFRIVLHQENAKRTIRVGLE
jgi:hypothetical protein